MTDAASEAKFDAGSICPWIDLRLLARTARAEQRRHPGAAVEIWATDEHRIGLKPVTRRIWAPRGERPIALGHHRFEWLDATGFVDPTTGKIVWNISNAISKPLFEAILAVPDGIRLVFQLANSPELQPANPPAGA